MRSPEEVLTDLESDRAQREKELRLLEKLVSGLESDDDIDCVHRAITLLSYAHLEGFCKFSLLTYLQYLNARSIECAQVNSVLVASTLKRVFVALRDVNSKHESFRTILTNDAELHLLAREAKFVESVDDLKKHKVSLPDEIVDTKWNLSPAFLKKCLFQLGLPHSVVDEVGPDLSRLLSVRNAIAHGDLLKKPKAHDVKHYIETSYRIMEFVQRQIYDAMKNQRYLKAS